MKKKEVKVLQQVTRPPCFGTLLYHIDPCTLDCPHAKDCFSEARKRELEMMRSILRSLTRKSKTPNAQWLEHKVKKGMV